MIKNSDLFKSIPCIWDESRLCEGSRMCDKCAYMPADEDKPNGRKDAVKIGWFKESDGSVYPKCPACGEMPHNPERCIFCGQKFIQNDPVLQDYLKPPEIIRKDCFHCGGKNTMVGSRARSNGHFHGRCEQCGCSIIT